MALTNLNTTYRSAANDWPTSNVVNVQMGGYPDHQWRVGWNLVGGWATPLKNDGVKVNWEYDDIPNIWKNLKKWVPKHQPAIHCWTISNRDHIICHRYVTRPAPPPMNIWSDAQPLSNPVQDIFSGRAALSALPQRRIVSKKTWGSWGRM